MAVGQQLSDMNSSGTSLGQSATDLISLYGVTPAAQRAASVQAAAGKISAAIFGWFLT